MQLSPIHRDYNQSTLDFFNYTIFSNGTVSNGSNCYLSFGQFHPILYSNGSWDNQTSCDYPVYSIKARGGVGMAWAVLLVVLIPLTLFNLRKHGRLYLEESRQFRRISRKGQWYWLFVLQALGAISGFFSIDIDRDYIQGSSLTSYGAIYSATLPVSLAVVWELTRHWSSFEERKIHDEDPFRFPPSKDRTRAHILMPIVFYLFAFLTFFLSVVRNWNKVSDYQPGSVIDPRWKAGGIFAIFAWLQIIAQIVITRIYYKVTRVPLVIPLVIFIDLVLVAFNLTYMWNYGYSPFNVTSSVVFVAIMGYLPIFALVVVVNIAGLARENDDQVLVHLRRIRDRETSAMVAESSQNRTSPQQTFKQPEIKTEEQTAESLASSSTLSKGDLGSSFFRFFGAPKPKSWLAQNSKYLPFTSQDRKDRQKEIKRSFWFWKRSSKPTTRRPSAPAPPSSRTPPRDIREGWKVKTVSGV